MKLIATSDGGFLSVKGLIKTLKKCDQDDIVLIFDTKRNDTSFMVTLYEDQDAIVLSPLEPPINNNE